MSGFIHVGVRAKPGSRLSADPTNATIGIHNKYFKFDQVYLECSNTDVFENSARHIVAQVCNGFNGTVFAYGQTGSGKTHTMFGNPNDPGIVEQAVVFMFDQVPQGSEISLSYLEIYNENMFDLLGNNNKLKLFDTKDGSTAIPNKTKVKVGNLEEVLHLLQIGNKSRKTFNTEYNSHSSRSHAVVQLEIKGFSTLNLCDLAGSEQGTNIRDRNKEGANINKSLSTLSMVISARLKNNKHIPFRNSLLTRLLRPSLLGSSLVSMICTVNDSTNTLSSLRFAQSVRRLPYKVEKQAKYNTEELQAEIKRLREENNLLREENTYYKDQVDVTAVENDPKMDLLLEQLEELHYNFHEVEKILKIKDQEIFEMTEQLEDSRKVVGCLATITGAVKKLSIWI